MSQTFYLLAERAKNYSPSESKREYSKRKAMKETENDHNSQHRNCRNSGEKIRGDGIIICV
jgi:hypothetical protein